MDFLRRVFDTEGFPPRWNCGEGWAEDPALGWVHVVSDIVIWLAYLLIPLVLGYFAYKRQGDVVFTRLFWLFCAFIFACGTVHLIEAVIFWAPFYRLSAVAKSVTAVASVMTVGAIVRVAPDAISLPSLREALGTQERLAKLNQQIFDAAPIGLVLVAEDGLIRQVNKAACELFGYASSELEGQLIDSLVPRRHRSDHPDQRRAYWRDPSPRPMGHGRDLFGVHKSGREVPVEIGLTPFEAEGADFVLASIVDLTERKLQEAELRDLNQDLEQFAYVASHDLKAPLRAIDHLAKWISEEKESRLSTESAEDLSLLRQRVGRMETLLDDLLAYSRAGRQAGEVSAIDLSGLIAGCIQLVDLPTGFSVESELAEASILGRRTPLETVVRNLIGNAIKHHDRPEGKITVTVDDDPATSGFYRFGVRDDGPGIPEQYRDKVFTIFQTLKARDDVEGSGMGLAVVKKLVEAEGGTVWIEGNSPRGSVFWFTWPREAQLRSTEG